MDSAFFDEWIYIYQPFPCASALKLCATPTVYLTKSHVRCFDNIICRTSENSPVQHRPMSWWSWIRVVAPVVSVKNTRYKFSKKYFSSSWMFDIYEKGNQVLQFYNVSVTSSDSVFMTTWNSLHVKECSVHINTF